MMFLYGARYSSVPLRPKKGQTASTKCRKVDLYGEMGTRKFSDFISQRREDPRRPDPLTLVRALL